MFDTHCHLNFSRFKKTLNTVISGAFDADVKYILVPGTDIKSSIRAVAITSKHKDIYCAVGIHPHHVYSYLEKLNDLRQNEIDSKFQELEKLVDEDLVVIRDIILKNSHKVRAVGEVGIDKHEYGKTVYGDYSVSLLFLKLQKYAFCKQVELAISLNKSLIIHNRQAKDDLLHILDESWHQNLKLKSVFHCCEAKNELLSFALKNQIFIGVDGDITYDKEKQDFINQVPLELLVIETDSPFLLPEPLRSQKKYPNEPRYLSIIIDQIAKIKGSSKQDIVDITTYNGKKLFGIS